MNQDTVISKINGFMFQMTGELSSWLGKRLPQFTDKWWFELVINNLTQLQRQHVIDNNITDIDGLDLAALLCVFDRNWIMLSNRYYMNNKYRSCVKKMREIRNTWAHITPNDISKKRVINDVDVMIEVMELIDTPTRIISSLEAFQFDVEESGDFSEHLAMPVIFDSSSEGKEEDESIKAGSMVVLKSNPNVTGVVMSVDGEQYTVFADGEPQTFFKEQIQLKQKEKKKTASLQRVRTALTAYQLNNPANSNLYSLNTARIDFVPYQFRPALKMVKSDAQRILIADDVGVGKTIEAGLILKELEARNHIKSVLVICPRALVVEKKWQIEMENFDESFKALDGKTLSEALIQTQKTGMWPEQYNKIIIPYSLFNEDSVMGTLSESNRKKKTVGLVELDIAPHFDLVIVDEAHHIRNDQTWMYKGVEQFCQNAGAVVFLTATPLQNGNRDLYTLLNLLRPDIVADEDIFESMSEPNRYINKMLGIVKAQGEDWKDRAKEEINNILNTTWGRNVIQHMPSFERVYEYLDNSEISREEKLELITLIESLHSFANIITRTRRNEIGDFCERRENTSSVEFTQIQQDLYEALIEFESAVLSRIHGRRSVRFMMMTLMRQAASCIYGLAPLMNDITTKRLEQLQEEGELLEEDYELNDEDVNLIYELADTISDLSEKLPDDDPKFEKAYQIIKETEQVGRKVIVFSSFRCTLSYLKNRLLKRGIRVGQVDGSVPDDMRRSLRERFKLDSGNSEALDVLLFSEVGCEGLDYQFCDTMINYDLPWNPMRIEQRIGRIDRRGQKSPAVKIYNIITKGTIDEKVYQYCLRKIDIFRESVGDCATILGDVSKLIMEIMLNPDLTEAEQNMHMEQLADNEIREIQEMRRLEKEEKSLFGFDLSQYMIDQDVQNAECAWVSPDQISKLTNTFLKDFLGDSEYIIGKGDVKNLRLKADYRQKLYRDYLENKPANQNRASVYWTAYLQSDKPNLSVTYDAETARNDITLTFLTPMHPLVTRAAEYESKGFFPCNICIEVNEELLPKGEYSFSVYAWRYYGLRPDIKLIAISDNEMVEANVISYLQFASQGDADFSSFENKWRNLDKIHYEKWQRAKEDFVNLVQEDSSYRADQITQSYQQSVDKIQKILIKLKEEKIINMRKRQIEKLRYQYEEQIAELDKTRQGAEIRATRLIKGVLRSI